MEPSNVDSQIRDRSWRNWSLAICVACLAAVTYFAVKTSNLRVYPGFPTTFC